MLFRKPNSEFVFRENMWIQNWLLICDEHDIRLVHVLWYDILGRYFGMILPYFGMILPYFGIKIK
jgi:hypothetical protein